MYETHKILVVSTANITEETNNFLETDEQTGSSQYGHFLWNPLMGSEPNKEMLLEDELDDLADIFRFAYREGCAYVLIDRDADALEELPVYDW